MRMKFRWKRRHFKTVCTMPNHTRGEGGYSASRQRQNQLSTMAPLSEELLRRAATICGLRAGRSVQEIADFFQFPVSTVYRLKRQYDEHIAGGGSSEDFPAERKGYKRRRDSTEMLVRRNILQTVRRTPGRSMRQIAVKNGVSHTTVQKILIKDGSYKSYALKRGQLLTPEMKEKRVERARVLLLRLKKPKASKQIIFFSDEKNFTQDQKVNRKNNRWLCRDISEVPVVMHTKFPQTVMVLGVVSSEGDVMPPYFFPKGLKVNSEEYVKVLETVVKPWMDSVAGERHYVFQQDGAPAHSAKMTQDWLRARLPEFFEKEVWPPSSPDCNPLDYFFWSECERETNAAPHTSVASLKAKITAVMAKMDRDTVAKACHRFRTRLEAVVAANGDFIE